MSSACSFIKKRLQYKRFPVNFAKFLKINSYRTPQDNCVNWNKSNCKVANLCDKQRLTEWKQCIETTRSCSRFMPHKKWADLHFQTRRNDLGWQTLLYSRAVSFRPGTCRFPKILSNHAYFPVNFHRSWCF